MRCSRHLEEYGVGRAWSFARLALSRWPMGVRMIRHRNMRFVVRRGRRYVDIRVAMRRVAMAYVSIRRRRWGIVGHVVLHAMPMRYALNRRVSP